MCEGKFPLKRNGDMREVRQCTTRLSEVRDFWAQGKASINTLGKQHAWHVPRQAEASTSGERWVRKLVGSEVREAVRPDHSGPLPSLQQLWLVLSENHRRILNRRVRWLSFVWKGFLAARTRIEWRHTGECRKTSPGTSTRDKAITTV